jgi:hypothetical protein
LAHRHRKGIISSRLRDLGPHGMILGDGSTLDVLSIPVSLWNPAIMVAAFTGLPRSLLMSGLYWRRPPLVLLPQQHDRDDHWYEGDHFGKTAKKVGTWHILS